MSFYGLNQDPYNMFRLMPRVNRRRGMPQTLRGGGRVGQPGGISRPSGGGNQLVGARPSGQSSAGGRQPRGMGSITTGPAPEEQPQQEGLLGGLLGAKASYDATQDAFAGGKNLAKKYNDFDGQEFGQKFLDDSSLSFDRMLGHQPDAGLLDRELRRLNGGSGDIPSSPNMTGRLGDSVGGPQPLTRGVANAGPAPVKSISQMQATSPPLSGVDPASQFFKGTQLPPGSNLNTGASGLMGSGAAGAQSAFVPQSAGGLSKIPAGSSAVNPGTLSLNAGGSAVVSPAAGNSAVVGGAGAKAGIDGLGAAGGGLGVGMSAYDIAQNGATFGNVTGLAGSAALGAVALGAANAWNPVGWALLGASALDSVFDIF